MKQIQINWQVKQAEIDGRVMGGTMKALLNVIPDAEYREMQRAYGFDTDMRISLDGLANQLANENVSHGRTIYHRAKAHIWEFRGASGLQVLPMVDRYFDLDQFGRAHFNHVVTESFRGPERAEAGNAHRGRAGGEDSAGRS